MEMTATTPPRDTLRGLLSNSDFLRLWCVGGTVNAMRWVEMLAAALFTYDVTGSGMAVAFVSAARTLPLLCFGAVAGVVSDAVSRKTILQAGLLLSAAASLCVLVLALLGVVQPWHIAAAAFASGTVWATEMATRRRMVGEAAGPSQVARAVALDSLTGACTRGIGPIIGSTAYAWLGISGAFAISAALYLVAASLVPGLAHSQETRRLMLSRVPRELAEGFAFARTQPTVLAVLGVTMTMNLFAFSYVALVAPIARGVFEVSAGLAGVLAAAEPLGSLIGGLFLAGAAPKASPRTLMLTGSAAFLVALVAMPLMPGYWLACAVLTVGGIGLAFFGNMQTSLVLTGVPAHVRSRQMGLITVCIGTGPLGQILIGTLAERLGPLGAVITVASLGLLVLALVATLWARAERPPSVFA
jgi:MFS family permease